MKEFQILNGFICKKFNIYCSTLFCLSEMKTHPNIGKINFLDAAYVGLELLQEINILPETTACLCPLNH